MRHFIEEHGQVTETIDSPTVVKLRIPLDELTERKVAENRDVIADIISGKSDRLLVVAAMQSARDVETVAVLSQALEALQNELSNLYIVLRIFCPICDMYLSRELLREGNAFNIPVGMKFHSPYMLTYTEDMVSWALADDDILMEDEDGSIAHEGFTSGLAMPFALESGPRNLDTVAQGIRNARNPGRFIGPDQSGRIALHRTRGNSNGHAIVRGTEEAVSTLSEENIPYLVKLDMPSSRGYAYSEIRRTFTSMLSLRRESRSLAGVYLYSASFAPAVGTLDYLLRHLNNEMEK